ncbi:hypothetical protein H4R34_000696 [Dimargaris verticillata]|uniref:t-SNARE coiled-coil homology domain-containing protein n=1 Tax=Dimargaris verticillata TaxID=2761393 RepID=A0A9W8EBM3_9FUNG|nr:hypothetical protein H4R34_000696 [Dimargaris verticillata]
MHVLQGRSIDAIAKTKGSSPWRPSESVAVDVDPSASLLGTRDSPDWFNDEQTQQTTIMHHQDQQLEAVHGTVRNIRTMAHTMGTELEDHNV